MLVRWYSTVRSVTNSAAATSRFVSPLTTWAATCCSVGVNPTLDGGRPPRRSNFITRPPRPERRAEPLEHVQAGLQRCARRSLVARPALHRTHGQLGTRRLEWERCLPVADKGALECAESSLGIATGGGGEAAPSRRQGDSRSPRQSLSAALELVG